MWRFWLNTLPVSDGDLGRTPATFPATTVDGWTRSTSEWPMSGGIA